MHKTLSALSLLLTTSAATGALAGDHGAMTATGLSEDRMPQVIDTSSAMVTESMEVTGVDRLVGIDLRPSNGQLIGVTDSFEIVEIDPETGAATVISMDKGPPIEGDAPVIVDFSPMADKLRFMSGTTNHRVDMGR